MPSTYAHYTLGQKVLEILEEDKKKIILENIDLYNIGLHGPDILFYYKPYEKNKVNQRGHKIHDERAKAFFEINEDLVDKSRAHEAYLYGFLCHFALDQKSHGYVGEIEKKGFTHTEIEAEFDKFLMEKDGISNPRKEKLTKHIKANDKNSNVIKDFFSGFTQGDIKKSLRGMNFFHEFLRSPGVIKRSLLNLIFNIFNLKFFKGLLISKKDRPEFNEFNKELYGRYKDAISNSKKLIEEFKLRKVNNEEFDQIYLYDFGSVWRGK